jgi:hypothetical protein
MNCVIGRKVINHVGIHGNAQSGLPVLLRPLLSSSLLDVDEVTLLLLNNLCELPLLSIPNDEDDGDDALVLSN